MGLLGMVKSLFSGQAMAEQTIKAQIDSMNTMRRLHPEYDTHRCLLEIYLHRLKMRFVDVTQDTVQYEAMSQTHVYSCLEPMAAARALGLLIFFNESQPDAMTKYPELAREHIQNWSSYKALKARPDFFEIYSKANPLTSQLYTP